MRRLLFPFVAALSMLLAQPALAVDPQGNDAGSGVDAPDGTPAGLPIEPGAHEGTLTYLTDYADSYSVQARRGDVAVFNVSSQWGFLMAEVLDPRGNPVGGGFLGNGQGAAAVTEDGLWTLVVRWVSWANRDPAPPVQPYAFTIAVGPAATFLAGDADEGWTRAEVVWNGTGAGAAVMGVRVPLTTMGGQSAFLRAEMEFPTTPDGLAAATLTGWYSWDHAGNVVRVEDVGVQLPPEASLDLQVQNGYVLWSVRLDALPRILRLTMFTAGDAPLDAFMTVATDAPAADAAIAEGGGVVAWNEATDPDVGALVTPVLSAYGARSFEADLDATWLGIFQVNGGMGRATRPDGAVKELGPEDYLFLANPAEGRWTFALDPGAEPVYHGHDWFQGVAVPSLGVAESRFF